jgi:ABC-type uncharacterized transport system YnjBCD ATPase subunit
MGRVIVREPKAFLTDEPLSNLAAKLPRVDASELAPRVTAEAVRAAATGLSLAGAPRSSAVAS